MDESSSLNLIRCEKLVNISFYILCSFVVFFEYQIEQFVSFI